MTGRTLFHSRVNLFEFLLLRVCQALPCMHWRLPHQPYSYSEVQKWHQSAWNEVDDRWLLLVVIRIRLLTCVPGIPSACSMNSTPAMSMEQTPRVRCMTSDTWHGMFAHCNEYMHAASIHISQCLPVYTYSTQERVMAGSCH